MEMDGRFCQTRLPLYREVGRNGLFLKNSGFTDDLRRAVTARLPQGAPEKMALVLECRIERIYDEHAGESRYTLDTFVTGLMQLPREDARRVLRKIARWIDALVIESPAVES